VSAVHGSYFPLLCLPLSSGVEGTLMVHCIHWMQWLGGRKVANCIKLQVEGHRGHAACPSRLGPD